MSKSDIFLLRLKGKIFLQSWVSLLTAFGQLNPQYLSPAPSTKGVGLTFRKRDFNRFVISDYGCHLLFLYLGQMHLDAKKDCQEQFLRGLLTLSVC